MSRKTCALIFTFVFCAGIIFLPFHVWSSSGDTVPLVEEPGCLACHRGIGIINNKMQPYLLGFAQQVYGKEEGYECIICHEGNPTDYETAHEGLIPNPSSMWVLHQGKGKSPGTRLPGFLHLRRPRRQFKGPQ